LSPADDPNTGAAYRQQGLPKWLEFVDLRSAWDPQGIFLTDYWRTHLIEPAASQSTSDGSAAVRQAPPRPLVARKNIEQPEDPPAGGLFAGLVSFLSNVWQAIRRLFGVRSEGA